MQANEEMLKEEIEFWRSMIESRTAEISEQVTERMINALGLAERKLFIIGKDPSPSDLRQ